MKPKTRKEREVWEALNYLHEQNLPDRNLTGELIGDCLIKLGYNRGSNADIYRYKKTWLLAQANVNDDSLKLNNTLPDPISKAAATLREKLESEAQAKIDKIQQAADEKSQVVQAQIEELTLSLTDAQTRYEQMQAQKEALETNCQTLSDELQQTRSNYRDALEQEKCLITQLETLRSTYQQHLDELKHAHQRSLAELHQQQLDQGLKYQQMFDQLKLETSEKDASRAALLQLKDASIDHLKAQLNKMQAKIDTKVDTIKGLTKTLNAKASEFEIEKKHTHDTLTHHSNQLKHLQGEVTSKELKVASLEGILKQTTKNQNQLNNWHEKSGADFRKLLKKLNDIEKTIKTQTADSHG